MNKQSIDVLNKDASGVNNDIPTQVVKLPSGGVLYEEDHPLHGESEVLIKEMTNFEENILISPALVKKGEVVNELIKACLINKSIDPGDLIIGDKSAILLAIRISGFGSGYKVKTICPACDGDFVHQFNLSECELLPLGAAPTKPNTNLFSFELPRTKRMVTFRLLTAGDESDISQAQANRRRALKRSVGNISEVNTSITDRLVKAIVSIGKVTDKDKIQTLVRNMPALDSRPLQEYIREIEPEVNLVEEVTCTHCGSLEEHEIPMGVEFLWPKRRKPVRRK